MEKKDLKIVFMGTPEFAVETLRALVEGGYNVVAVVTQPDKPVGRHGSVLRAPAVKEYALSVGLPVLQPEKMKAPTFIEELRSYEAIKKFGNLGGLTVKKGEQLFPRLKEADEIAYIAGLMAAPKEKAAA